MENKENISPGIEILDLDVKSFNALKREGINTVADIEAQTEQLGSTIPPKQWTSIINALNAYKGIPIPGSWVEEDMLGEELTFDEIAEMVGETIIMDMSTESHAWYKAVMIEKIVDCEGGGRRLMYYDGAKQRGLVGEMFFNKDQIRPERAWRVKLQDKPAEPPAPTQTETAMPAVFDYSDLDSETAAKLEEVTNEIINVKKKYIFAMAEQVKKAHDLLANCKNGMFGAWCTSLGISRDTGNNLVNIAEIFGNISTEEQKNLSQLKPSLLYEVAKPSAPPELVEQVKSGDITTHKEYIALKKELEEANKKIELAEFRSKQQSESFKRVANASKTNYEKYQEERHKNDDLEKQLSEVKESLNISEDDVRKAEERAEYAENKITEISVKKHELEQRIKELENRPVDVAVDVDELNRRVAEAVSKINSETEHTLAAERRDFADTINAKDDKIWALEDKIKELESRPVPNSGEKIFAVKMTMEQYQQLVDVINDSKNKELAAIIKRVKFFNV